MRRGWTAQWLYLVVILTLIVVRDQWGAANAAAHVDTTKPTPATRLYEGGAQLPWAAKQRGVSWVGTRAIDADHLDPVAALNADWIVQTPFGWQPGVHDPDLRLSTSGHLWGETDEGLTVTTRHAHDLGLKVMLKPHIWLRRSADGKWRSDIAMQSEEDWTLWWENYRTFMLHYARLAQDTGMAGLCIGTELGGTVSVREADWRRLIADVRAVYSGMVIYAANWYDEYERVPFWDALDAIGIQAYFPLSRDDNADLDALIAGWQPHLQAMAEVSRRFGKPVLFTEVGYRATPDAAREPWLWPQQGVHAEPAGLAMQARCYEAFFQAVWPQPWIAGVYIWKWHPRMSLEPPREPDIGFTPQHKPAVEVLARYYRGL